MSLYKKPFIIAEIGNNHEGSFSTAKKLITEAANAGVDAVKFQTYNPESFISKKEKKKLKILKKFHLSKKETYNLYKFSKSKGLKFISTPLDIESANFLGKFVDQFKIASGDNDFDELIRTVFRFKKKTIISTGLVKIAKIKNIIKFARQNKFPLKKLSLLHCVSSYPAENKDLNLNFISSLKKLIDKKIKIGYSDHSIGLAAPILAYILGSDIIEKHFTLSNDYSSFRDHKLSLNPRDMKMFVKVINDMALSFGNKNKSLSKFEKTNFLSMRRSYYFNKKMKKGKQIKSDDIIFKRPRLKNSEINFKKIVGKKIKYNVNKDQVILKKMI